MHFLHTIYKYIFKRAYTVDEHQCAYPIHPLVIIQLLERLKFYAGFEINDQSGTSLTDHEMTDVHYKRYIYLLYIL